MPDALLPEKLQLLALYFPQFLKHALEELLSSCNGDIDATKALVNGHRVPTKRLALTQQHLSHVEDAPKRRKTAKAGELPPSPAKGSKGRVITLNTPQDVARALHPYASLHLNFLPKDVADRLLDELMDQKQVFHFNQFYLFGNECVLNHGVATFSRPEAVYPKLVYNGKVSRTPTTYSETFEKAAKVTEDVVRNEIAHAPKLTFQRPEPWTSDFCVANYYEKMLSNLQWHSDRLSHIGPHNFVASVSVGATRMFRLRSTHQPGAPIYQVPLPHNSLLLMRAGCQEEYKHCVSSMSRPIALHPKAGSTRFGLTFRHYPLDFIANLPKCACDMRMVLRRTYKQPETRGKYFWLCENVYQNKDCGAFEYADFSNEEGHYIAESADDASVWIAPEDSAAQAASKHTPSTQTTSTQTTSAQRTK